MLVLIISSSNQLISFKNRLIYLFIIIFLFISWVYKLKKNWDVIFYFDVYKLVWSNILLYLYHDDVL